MEELNQDKKSMPKPKLDESKLTTEQKQALAIARGQKVSFSRKLDDLYVEIDVDSADELIDAIIENRKRDRTVPPKSSF